MQLVIPWQTRPAADAQVVTVSHTRPSFSPLHRRVGVLGPLSFRSIARAPGGKEKESNDSHYSNKLMNSNLLSRTPSKYLHARALSRCICPHCFISHVRPTPLSLSSLFFLSYSLPFMGNAATLNPYQNERTQVGSRRQLHPHSAMSPDNTHSSTVLPHCTPPVSPCVSHRR